MPINNDHLPNASTDFIVDTIRRSGKVIEESELRIGNTITFVLKKEKATLQKRIITIRDFEGEVNFMQAMAHAITFRFIGELLEWFKNNKGWKEGGYTE